MTKLSVNVNKIATLRNARGGNVPNVLKVALDCERFGAQGITVHPRPDERHIRYADVYDLKANVTTEFNIEGNPIPQFIKLVKEVCPTQVTLVPDAPDALTSNAGWDCINNHQFLTEVAEEFHQKGIRVSVFVGTDLDNIRAAATLGIDRIELYTEPYAANYAKDREAAIAPFVEAAKLAHSLGLEINAGHDLNTDNLAYFHQNIPFLAEVSIGHALISDALYWGLEQTVKRYRDCLV
ncbi:MAG: pyridoxine 5'-phosphate synthase [Paludibacteraceae bacterium]|nr:pyridoxine 5'-phosphate synthase [Paludibacteraceae bacterium]